MAIAAGRVTGVHAAFARGQLAMATRALTRKTAEVATLVTVEARQRAMHRRQATAYSRVIETRRGKRPLRMALAAAWRQRVAMDVVLAVAVDAQISRARQRPVIAMASRACQVVVATFEGEVADVVHRSDVAEGLRRVALLARSAVLAAMHIGFGMTAKAGRRPRLERHRWMTIHAANLQMLPGELEARHGVVAEDVVTGFDVTAPAFVTEPSLVRVVDRMASNGAAVGRRAGEHALGMTAVAGWNRRVQSREREFRIVVIKARGFPNAR